MNAPKRARSHVDGVVLLNKPLGISSQQAVSRVRHLLNAAKAGHTGTLDPAADGLLPICLGEATKFSHLLLDADKTYVATVRLGVVTDTGDAEGKVLETLPPVTDRDAISRVMEQFRGEQQQMPPMHSALKHRGVPLYEYARKGISIERQTRTIRILDIQLIDLKDDCLTIEVRCSKGTYIRVLAMNIGQVLGCGASLAGLTRTHSGMFGLDHPAACTLPVLSTLDEGARLDKLLPVDTLLAGLPEVNLAHDEAQRMLLGQKLGLKHLKITGLARLYGPEHRFLGLAEVEAGGRTIPHRMLAQHDTASHNVM